MKNHNNMQQQMSVQQTVSDMSHPKPVVSPNQYFLQDDFGNFAYGYSTQNSERAEEGNAQSKKGHFANIMADGKLRRVDYIADNQGFHILRDTADNTGKYIKREAETSVEPDLIRTRMTSYMDSSSIRNDNDNDMHKMSNNQMGRDMSSSMMQRDNQLTSKLYRANNLMGRDMSSLNIMGRDMSSINMMGRDMPSMNMMGRDMSSMTNMGRDMSSMNKMGRDMSSMNNMGQDMSSVNMMGRDMSSVSMMGRDMSSMNNMMDQGMVNNMMGNDMSSMNTLGRGMSNSQMGQEMSSNLMGRDMYSNRMMSSNMMGRDMNRMAPLNKMSQRMQIETMPSQSLNRFF